MATCEVPSLVTWSERYSVGISRIDAEHQTLIAIVNELYAAMLASKDAAILGNVLGRLAEYTVSHFTNEETLMRRHGYPDYGRHKAEHDALVVKVVKLQQDQRAGKPVISKDVMVFLQQWLLSHILGSDKKYTTHLQKAGVR